jgi:gas vesicle protein
MTKSRKGFISGAVVGGTLGAMAILLFTGEGKKLQKEIVHAYKKLGMKASKWHKRMVSKAKGVTAPKKISKVAKRRK